MIYTLHLSNGGKIPVNELELKKFKENISSNFIELTGGIINPSFVVSVLVDIELTMLENKRRMSQLNTADFNDKEILYIKNNLHEQDPYTIKQIDAIINRTLTIK